MTQRAAPVLSQDDPEKEPLIGNIKVTREDWLNIARDVLVHDGVADIKILGLSNRLGVSRSSFYWYFKDRADLLSALLEEWEARNTRTIAEYCNRPAPDINAAACNFFRCFIDPALFDQGLDFAVREWARRDSDLRARLDVADAARLEAVRLGSARTHGAAHEPPWRFPERFHRARAVRKVGRRVFGLCPWNGSGALSRLTPATLNRDLNLRLLEGIPAKPSTICPSLKRVPRPIALCLARQV